MRRATTIALVIFQSLWLNVVLPGHTRGAITLPGYEASSGSSQGCCKPQDHDSRDSNKPTDRAAHCAICFFAARLTLPDVIDLNPAPLGLAGDAPDESRDSIASIDLRLTYLGRGPPVA